MRKYIKRYPLFWLPAAVAAYFFTVFMSAGSSLSQSMPSQIIQWLCALIMLFGWAVNTGMCAYYYPLNTLSMLLAYFGVSILLVVALYETPPSTLHNWLNIFVGIFSYKPLDILVKSLLDFNIKHEFIVICILVGFCGLGYFGGILFRRLYPNPYRPKLYRSR